MLPQENLAVAAPDASPLDTNAANAANAFGESSHASDSGIAALRRVPLFEGLSENELRQVRALMDARTYAPGQTIIREGEPGDEFFVIVAGRTRTVVLDAAGHEIVLDESEAGGFFGELSMLTGEPRSARIVALSQVATLVLDRDEFFDFLRVHPGVAVDVLIVLGRRLHRTDSLLRSSVSRNASEVAEEKLTLAGRIAEALAGLFGRLGFLIGNLVFVLAWIAWNHPALGGHDFDPYPFGLLGMVLGLEALLFSILVLNNQSRQEAKDRIAEEIHHQVNKKSELEIGLMLRRLDDLERSVHYVSDEQLQLLRAFAARDASPPVSQHDNRSRPS